MLLWLSRFAVGIFYRSTSVGPPVPERGPVILVANHPNGLVDPVLVSSTTGREVRLLAKAPLFEMPVMGLLMRAMGALPVYRVQDGADTALNKRTFEAVFAALRQGDLVCLFPEGKSHDEPTLQRLKTGAARMALGAAAGAEGSLDVRIIPLGLVYRAKRRFRSQACVCIGEPIGVQDLLGLYSIDEREAVGRLNERIASGLGKVTLNLKSWADLPLLELASTAWAPTAGGDPAQLQAFSRKLWQLRSGEAGCAPDLELRIEQLSERVASFRARLEHLNMRPGEIHPSYQTAAVLRFALINSIRLFLMLPLYAAGSLLWAVPYQLVAYLARWMKIERDQYATVQILSGIVFFPLWWIALVLAGSWQMGSAAGWSVALGAPFLGLMALSFMDWRRETLPDARAFWRLGNRRRLRELLHAERLELAKEIESLRASLDLPEDLG